VNARIQIAFLTGRSDPVSCALSPEQADFLRRLRVPGLTLLETNFPYASGRPYRDVFLPRAACNNVLEYLRSRRPEFARHHGPHVRALIEQAERTVFLAGSCGLELFNNLALPAPVEGRCTLICYGPVARRLPRRARALVVQSARDSISRVFFRWPERRLACGHMAYLRDERFLQLCQAEISTLASTPCFSTSA